jgi:GTP pyrophosphokinase
MVPLRYRLSDGDTVEIVTSASQYPRKDWLDFVVTGKARSRIRNAIRATERARSIELGRDILDRELRKAHFSLKTLLANGELEKLATKVRRGTVDDLFSAVSYGRVSAAELVRRLRGEEAAEAVEPAAPKRRLFWRQREPASRSGIRVSGQHDVMVRFGRCCGPLPGDDVVGFVTRGRGVTIHTRECVKVFELDPDRRIDVEWEIDNAVAQKIKVRVLSVDQPGLLAKITKTISTAQINIGSANITTNQDRKAVHTFELWVKDVDTLNAVMKQMGRIKGVLAVERVRT